ncbi:MAG: hypothetical protein OXI49_11705 [Acidobacteriota bacterium]|nr:hypothetical protein [Acidobacteriota bacterium]
MATSITNQYFVLASSAMPPLGAENRASPGEPGQDGFVNVPWLVPGQLVRLVGSQVDESEWICTV